MKYRVAVLGTKNATPVSASFRYITDARAYLRTLAEGPDYKGRMLIVKAYSDRGTPVRGFYDEFDSVAVLGSEATRDMRYAQSDDNQQAEVK